MARTLKQFYGHDIVYTASPSSEVIYNKVNKNLNATILEQFINDGVVYLDHDFKLQLIPMGFVVWYYSYNIGRCQDRYCRYDQDRHQATLQMVLILKTIALIDTDTKILNHDLGPTFYFPKILEIQANNFVYSQFTNL